MIEEQKKKVARIKGFMVGSAADQAKVIVEETKERDLYRRRDSSKDYRRQKRRYSSESSERYSKPPSRYHNSSDRRYEKDRRHRHEKRRSRSRSPSDRYRHDYKKDHKKK